MLDIFIDGAVVIDGTGNPGFRAAVGVKDGRIVLFGEASEEIEARQRIDARERVLTPGFIDLHSHAGLSILADPTHKPKVTQGVTTELVGVDGISHAPFKTAEARDEYIWLDAGLNGYAPDADWLRVRELLDRYDRHVAINMAVIVGNGPLRLWAAGWEPGEVTAKQLDTMVGVLREAVEEGAWGISTGLDYPPSANATTDELVALSRIAARFGGFYHTHTRRRHPRPRTLLEPFEEALSIGQAADIPVHLTHYLQRRQGEGSHHDYLGLVEGARNRGLDVTFDTYSYHYGSSTLAIELPHWTKDRGPRGVMEALATVDLRDRISAELEARPDWERLIHNNWLTGLTGANHRFDGMTIAQIAETRQASSATVFMDVLLEERLAVTTVSVSGNPATLPAFIAHPYGMIASDAILLGDHPNPRTYGCFPLVLAEFVRSERHLTLQEAIRKMTSFPAQRLGLRRRGMIRDGYAADLVVFDADGISAPATRENPKQFATGLDYVIVNGEIVVDHGEVTGALPGRALRRGRE